MITIDKFRNEAGDIYAHLSYEPYRNYLFMRWIGYSTEAEVMHASKAMMQWQKAEGQSKNCRFHVHDTKEIQGAWIGVVDWIRDEMWPFCYQWGMRYNLSVTSPDLFSKLSSIALKKQDSRQVTTVLFETVAAAENWLTEKYKSL
ncbi:hypothetical protein FO440_24245 [Mucilaginibacter corticis]|uniref:STAS/SEC14 domain-containing protein n=1 Tax=Mucilaginibacter corticis TaxID=2597670 RepID=A0A556M4Q7_9SPHI|nr:hypothetical protein [Mucilaginibacter corticis]TSJ34884.1 hypothetical protein FO440_24245 [Mucilaginibacter corticis]